jgi:hypothetical protein
MEKPAPDARKRSRKYAEGAHLSTAMSTAINLRNSYAINSRGHRMFVMAAPPGNPASWRSFCIRPKQPRKIMRKHVLTAVRELRFHRKS